MASCVVFIFYSFDIAQLSILLLASMACLRSIREGEGQTNPAEITSRRAPRRRARLREEAETLAEEIALAEEYGYDFAPTVDDIRSGRFLGHYGPVDCASRSGLRACRGRCGSPRVLPAVAWLYPQMRARVAHRGGPRRMVQ